MDMSTADIGATTLLVLACASCGHAAAKASSPTVGPEWEPLRGLVGSWEGRDQARNTTGRFTLAPELGGKVLVRHNVDETPQGRHEDLMVVYRDPTGMRAKYFDNEGHVIDYAVAANGTRVDFVSDEVANMPRFKLTYDVHGPGELAIDFAIAPPGTTEFKHYTGGNVHRVP